MNVYQWLCVFAVPNLVFLFWQTVINKHRKKKEEEVAKRRAEIEKQQEQIKKQNEAMEAQNRAMMLGVQALLRDRLRQSISHFISQGYAGYDDRENIFNMYKQYEALGPNSVMDDAYEQFKELPMQP